jgi:hypothetical protein
MVHRICHERHATPADRGILGGYAGLAFAGLRGLLHVSFLL